MGGEKNFETVDLGSLAVKGMEIQQEVDGLDRRIVVVDENGAVTEFCPCDGTRRAVAACIADQESDAVCRATGGNWSGDRIRTLSAVCARGGMDRLIKIVHDADAGALE